jgi:hypothetical protein
MNKLIRIATIIVIAAAIACSAFGQATLTVTSWSSAVAAGGASTYSTVFPASCTNINNPTLPIAGGPAIGDPSAAPYTYLVSDSEVMKVNNVVATSPCQVLVERGFTGSLQTGHISGGMVYVANPSQLQNYEPSGACTASTITTKSGLVFVGGTAVHPSFWTCTAAGQWAKAFSTDNSYGFALGYQATESGTNTHIACAKGCGPDLVPGLVVTILLAHSLQAGANDFAFNGGSALAIKSHLNPANNIGTAYVSTGVVQLIYSGSIWLDLSQ